MDPLKPIEATTNDFTAEEIIYLFEQYGNEDYDGERVSQSSHMMQCAMLAIEESEDEELILGAFLHDVGHLLKHEEPLETMGDFGVINHEAVGAAYLQKKGFSQKVVAIVEKHVDAKRYLVATDADYHRNLSEASWQTLQYQGGPMTVEEAEAFKQHPFFKDIISVRKWDERSKQQNVPLLALSAFRTLICKHLTQPNK